MNMNANDPPCLLNLGNAVIIPALKPVLLIRNGPKLKLNVGPGARREKSYCAVCKDAK